MDGKTLGQLGAQAAAEHAGFSWQEEAYKAFCFYGKNNKRFMTEDVRVYAESHGLPPPPDSRAWGGIVIKVKAEGLIRHLTYAPNKMANCHASPKSVWEWIGGDQ